MMELLTFVGVLLSAQVITGANLPICPNPTIKAEEGHDVTLQCRLDPQVNMVNYTIVWKRVDLNKEVHSYRYGQDQNEGQMDQYRNRTTLSPDDLSRGVLTLRISSVNLSDSGPYRCFVPNLKAGCTMNVTVVRRDKQDERETETLSTTRPRLGEANETVTPDGENRSEAVRAGVISSVVFILCLLIVVLSPLNHKLLLKYMKSERLRGRKEQKPEEASNGSEMMKLDIEAAEGDEDLLKSTGSHQNGTNQFL